MPKAIKTLTGLDLILTILRDAGPKGLRWVDLHAKILRAKGMDPEEREPQGYRKGHYVKAKGGETFTLPNGWVHTYEEGDMMFVQTGTYAPKKKWRGYYAGYFACVCRGDKTCTGCYLSRYVDHAFRGNYVINEKGLARLKSKGL